MAAHRNEPRLAWTKEGGVFDLIAISVSLGVIIAGLLIVNSASKNYTMTDNDTKIAPHRTSSPH
jgi:hypothetical protein